MKIKEEHKDRLCPSGKLGSEEELTSTTCAMKQDMAEYSNSQRELYWAYSWTTGGCEEGDFHYQYWHT